MASNYDHRDIEAKWQQRWTDERIFSAAEKPGSKKAYVLDMFPYPSGDGLHVGHPEGYTATDIYSRFLRMNNVSVLHPMGWDAFGLPAENYAIKMGVHPAEVTNKNIANFKRQIQSLGFSYDWDREVNTTDPAYYKWTQWISLQLFKRGLAYEKESAIWWCPKDKTGLANEEVVNGKCDRCGTTVEKKMLKQWMLKITAYADRLLDGLEKLDWPESIKALQRNWIGKSEGAEVDFMIGDQKVTVFTTRPDTLFGATYLVLSPEHELVPQITAKEQKKAVEKYVKSVAAKSDLERTSLEKEKTGVFTGAYAMNPVNNEKIPVWIADYVLSSYGTGAIMAVPAHDERDWEFAKKFELPIRQVIAPFYKNTTDLAVKAGAPVVRRPVAYGIIHRKQDDHYLCLRWKEHGWGSFVTGGIEASEKPVDAAKREILEEAGYTHVKHVSTIDWQVHTEFFAAHKQENRYGIATGEIFELIDDEKVPISSEEQDKHELVWVPANKVRDFVTHGNAKYIWDCYRTPSAFVGEGVAVNSGEVNGMNSADAQTKLIESLSQQGKASAKTQYKLRDWVFSRQRYWGEPIPLVHCQKCGVVAVPENELPLKLPDVEKYEPTGTGESPLAGITEWVNTSCPQCGGPAKRETNTMPQWAGSCWYYLRYLDPKNETALASADAMKTWLPVDMYVGGAEHAVLHLLYARFWHKVLFDAGVIPAEVGDEPFMKLKNQGLILGPDGEKMSKSRGNVINPDELVEKFGADTFRMYEMFMGPFEDAKPWDTNGMIGVRRFLDKVWRAAERVVEIPPNDRWHRYAKSITESIPQFRLNTCVSDLMKWVNEFGPGEVSKDEFQAFLKLLAPFAPHIAEELWSRLGHTTLLITESWPSFDVQKITDATATIVIQVMGKLRGTISMPAGTDQATAIAAAKAEPNVAKFLTREPKKTIFVKDKLINFVVS